MVDGTRSQMVAILQADYVGEIYVAKNRFITLCAIQICAAQVGAAQVSLEQVCAAQI